MPSLEKLTDLQRRRVVEITTRSYFREMLAYGFTERDVLHHTTELLELIMAERRAGVKRATGKLLRPAPPAEYQLDREEVTAIQGPSLVLLPATTEDGPALERWRAEAHGTLIERLLKADSATLLQRFRGAGGRLFVARRYEDDAEPVGFMAFAVSLEDPGLAEMKKFVAASSRRQGYGRQMTHLWLHYGFTHLGLRKVTVRTADSNLVNINLNRKLGFQFEGCLRQEASVGGRFADVTVMGVLREAYFKRHALSAIHGGQGMDRRREPPAD